jgi:hypothetical protein
LKVVCCYLLEASDILEISSEILRCAVIDDAGRILSYGESDQGREAKLPANFSVTIKALAIQSLSQALPKDLGNVRFTVLVTDRYRLVTMPLSGRTIMFAVPRDVMPDAICDAATKKYGMSPNQVL